MLKRNTVVGIFSREGRICYEWLILFLLTLPTVMDVRPVYISNNSSQNFRDEVSKCRFAILYHTKKRGRINITDVTDSLYDEELEYLFSIHGKKNIIVVVDDLEDTSSEEKSRILNTQPMIRRLVQELFLFPTGEKSFPYSHSPAEYQYQSPADSINENFENMKRIITGKYIMLHDDENVMGGLGPHNQNIMGYPTIGIQNFCKKYRNWLVVALVILIVIIVVVAVTCSYQ